VVYTVGHLFQIPLGGGGLWLTLTLVFAIRIFTLLIEFLKDQITTLHEYSHISQKLHQSAIQPKLSEVFQTIQQICYINLFQSFVLEADEELRATMSV
jgi:hypothetical protein